MPDAAEGADALLVGLLEHGDNMGIRLHVLDVGNPEGRAEAGHHGDLLLRRQLEIAEEEHGMTGEGLTQGLPSRLLGAARIETGDLGPQMRRGLFDLHAR